MSTISIQCNKSSSSNNNTTTKVAKKKKKAIMNVKNIEIDYSYDCYSSSNILSSDDCNKMEAISQHCNIMAKFFFWSEINWVFFDSSWVFSGISKMLHFDSVFCSTMVIKSKKKKKKVIYRNLRQCNWVFHQCVKSLTKKKNMIMARNNIVDCWLMILQ